MRSVSALVAPVFPLVVFLCCLLVEVAKPGLGIAGGLQDPGCSGGCKGDETWGVLGTVFVRSKINTLQLPSSVLPREALTLLYIGGASSSSSLLSCQETDGANEARMAVQMGRASMRKIQ